MRDDGVNQAPQKYSNLDILEPLVKQMTRRDPARRPAAANALQQWKALRRSVWSVQRYWRPRPREEPLLVKAFSDVFSLVRFRSVSEHPWTLTPDYVAISRLQVPTLVSVMGSRPRDRASS